MRSILLTSFYGQQGSEFSRLWPLIQGENQRRLITNIWSRDLRKFMAALFHLPEIKSHQAVPGVTGLFRYKRGHD